MAMSDEKLLEAIGDYRKMLLEKGVSPDSADRDSKSLTHDEKLSHILRMLEKMPDFLSEGRREKVMRWLGFIQGSLWAMDMQSVHDLKREVMPDDANPDIR